VLLVARSEGQPYETVMVGPYADLPVDPLSDHYGLDRGTPLDRHYIEAFLAGHREAIGGSVLEVQDDTYTTTFGADRVSTSAVVDIDEANPLATLIADLCEPDSLPADAYDCIILTQTLHLIRRPDLCVGNCFRGLRPGGTLLGTAPSLSRVSPTYPDADFWRFTPSGLAELFRSQWPGTFSTHAYGNLRTCIGFLIGQVVEEVPEAVLDHRDPRYPLTVAVSAHKPHA
jgi:SAM-dependent methyltransferase